VNRSFRTPHDVEGADHRQRSYRHSDVRMSSFMLGFSEKHLVSPPHSVAVKKSNSRYRKSLKTLVFINSEGLILFL
jgi:hypothetical protein